jgi:hypothetical protein
MQFQQTFGLTAILWTEAAATEHDHHRILTLQIGEPSMLPGVVAQLIVGKDGSLRHVRSHLDFSMVSCAQAARSQIDHDVA